MNVLDLCVGAGGLSLGFEQAGHRVIAGVDVWDEALDTYRHNHASVGLQEDLHSTDPSDLPLSKNQVQVVAGGPPCKGFSLAGERDSNDERNQLVARFLDYVKYYEPEYVVMENVTGIRSMALPGYDGTVPEYIHDRFDQMGYNSDDRTLNAKDYGVPQSRQRVFFIACQEGEPKFPEPTTADNPIPVGVVLSQDFTSCPNQDYTNHQQSTIDKMAPLDYEESVYDYGEAWKRLHPDKPSITIKENHGAPFVHPFEDRVGTPRECAAIQSFPNDYEFLGSKSAQLKQIGNAVPPRLAREVAKCLSG